MGYPRGDSQSLVPAMGLSTACLKKGGYSIRLLPLEFSAYPYAH